MNKAIERANAALVKVKVGVPGTPPLSYTEEFLTSVNQPFLYVMYLDIMEKVYLHKKEIEACDDKQLETLVRAKLAFTLGRIVGDCHILQQALSVKSPDTPSANET